MKRKVIAGLIFTFILISIILVACASTPYKETRAVPEKTFTVEELAEFNGKDGKKTFIAYQGIVYDLTGSRKWKNGTHKGNEAGKDITEKLEKAWHGAKVLKDKPIAGKLVK